MKTLVSRIITALLLAAAIAGCSATKEETAMEWLGRQPVYTDP